METFCNNEDSNKNIKFFAKSSPHIIDSNSSDSTSHHVSTPNETFLANFLTLISTFNSSPEFINLVQTLALVAAASSSHVLTEPKSIPASQNTSVGLIFRLFSNYYIA